MVIADRSFEITPDLRIAVNEAGDPCGHPVFFFHGWPASRLQGAGFGPDALALGLRIISPDRPGVGLSTPQPGRRLLDWPRIVAELADQLGLARFLVLAVSGGGPYGISTAHSLPDRVEGAAIVSGAPPLGGLSDPRDLMLAYRCLLALHARWPKTLRHLFHIARPIASARPPRWLWPFLLRFIPPSDRSALRDPNVFEGSFECYREAWRGSGHGVFADAELYAQDWGFELEHVQPPIRLWHGKADHAFSWRLAEAVARRLPQCTARFLENEGHFSLPIRHGRAILQDLLSTRENARSGNRHLASEIFRSPGSSAKG
jgi:pimeloyl-ACP methyl ester carboxylesterase